MCGIALGVDHVDFVDNEGELPLVDLDSRRAVYERVERDDSGAVTRRVSRLLVSRKGAPLGNHFHDFDEQFEGLGLGVLLLKDTRTSERTFLTLPEGGWRILVPAHFSHTFIFTGEPNPNQDGLVAVLLSFCDQEFLQDINTHADPLVIVPPRS